MMRNPYYARSSLKRDVPHRKVLILNFTLKLRRGNKHRSWFSCHVMRDSTVIVTPHLENFIQYT